MNGEHMITYAYPSSRNAERVGRAKTGAYCLAQGDLMTGHATYEEAVAAAAALGTAPARWSMDHPLNARFLPGST